MHDGERLKKVREGIDLVDAQIMRLLRRRFAAAKEIGEIKRQLGMDVLQPGRELEVIERARKAAREAGISEDFAGKLFGEIMAESRNVQKGTQKQQNVRK